MVLWFFFFLVLEWTCALESTLKTCFGLDGDFKKKIKKEEEYRCIIFCNICLSICLPVYLPVCLCVCTKSCGTLCVHVGSYVLCMCALLLQKVSEVSARDLLHTTELYKTRSPQHSWQLEFLNRYYLFLVLLPLAGHKRHPGSIDQNLCRALFWASPLTLPWVI